MKSLETCIAKGQKIITGVKCGQGEALKAIRSIDLSTGVPEGMTFSKDTLTSGFFASKTLGLDLDPMGAKSRYGMRDEQEKTFMLQKGPLGEDRLRVCTESSKHGRMFSSRPSWGPRWTSATPLASKSPRAAARPTLHGSQAKAGQAGHLSRGQRLLSTKGCKTRITKIFLKTSEQKSYCICTAKI